MIEVHPVAAATEPGGRSDGEETGSFSLVAGGRDITDVIITTSVGSTVTGRVVFEGSSAAPKPGRITATQADQGFGMPPRGGPDQPVALLAEWQGVDRLRVGTGT